MEIVESSNAQPVICACPSCRCPVKPGQEVVRDSKVYCSEICAYECTEQTCLCVHEHCGDDEKHH